MALEQSGVELVLEGLSEFLSGMEDAEGSTTSLADVAAGIGAAGLDALGGAMGMVADIAGSVLSAGLDIAVQGVQALAGGLTDGIRSAMEGEEAISSLNQVIRSTGGAAGLTSEDAQALAQQFAHLAGGSDDAVLAIETLGLRMGTISAAEMPQFIQASLDLGAVMGSNEAAARLLARAQEDPVGTMGQLRRAGILVSEELEAQIKEMVKAGDQAGAYALLMDRVAEATTGAAAAQGETLAGTWERITGTLGEAAESIGTAFLPMLHNMAATIESVVPFLTDFSLGLSGVITDLLEVGQIDAGLDFLAETIGAAFGPEAQQFVYDMGDAFNSVIFFLRDNLPLIQATFSEVWGSITLLTSELAAVWTESLGPALSSAFTTIFGQGPTAQQILESMLSALSTGAEMAAAWVRDTLVPAVQQFSEWVTNDFTPNAVLLREWLEVNIPIAVQMASDFFNNVILPALNALYAFIVNSVIPTLSSMVTWLQTNLPPAIQAASDFVNNQLLPALDRLWSFINTSVIPVFTTLWSFISTQIMPLLAALASVGIELVRIAFEALTLYYNTNVKPMLDALALKLNGEVSPAFRDLQTLLDVVVGPALQNFAVNVVVGLASAFSGVISAIQDAINWLNVLKDLLANIHLPTDLTPGSPTPFEIGLRGAASAANELYDEMKNLDRLGAGYNGPGVGLTSGVQRIAELVVDKMTVSALQVAATMLPQLTTSAPAMHVGYQGGPSGGGSSITNYTVNQSNHYARYSDPATVYDDTKLAFAFL